MIFLGTSPVTRPGVLGSKKRAPRLSNEEHHEGLPPHAGGLHYLDDAALLMLRAAPYLWLSNVIASLGDSGPSPPSCKYWRVWYLVDACSLCARGRST